LTLKEVGEGLRGADATRGPEEAGESNWRWKLLPRRVNVVGEMVKKR